MHSQPFLVQAPFDKPALKVRKIGPKQPPISADVVVMGPQTGDFIVAHRASNVQKKSIVKLWECRRCLTIDMKLSQVQLGLDVRWSHCLTKDVTGELTVRIGAAIPNRIG
ncbi:hypothetical protein AAFX91_40840, partial [Bradyrhizobium sp. 31Argb]|uniref:hypothetical protein n=1 Tax=Bradyrhizobium sp. 31Argb TaxID=3141247 RepID=UPI003748FE12